MSRHQDDHDDFGGLHRDLLAVGANLDRRQLMKLALSVGALQLLGCGTSATGTEAVATTTGDTTTTVNITGSTACSKIPAETEGPFPGDGSNGANVLNTTGIVRSDIRTSFGSLTGTADGTPLTIAFKILSRTTCAPLSGYAVYVWHCDRLGRYSLYSSGVTNQNYLRGVQGTDANGNATFVSVFPACYSGRWPHIHFEVYSSLTAAQSVSNKLATSQIAIPKPPCDLVYNGVSGYSSSITTLSQTSLSSDNVFSDGYSLETPFVTGSVASGFTITQYVYV